RRNVLADGPPDAVKGIERLTVGMKASPSWRVKHCDPRSCRSRAPRRPQPSPEAYYLPRLLAEHVADEIILVQPGGEPTRVDIDRLVVSRGTYGSNPASSSGESTNHRFRRRFHLAEPMVR